MNLTTPAIIRESSQGFNSLPVEHLLLTSRKIFFTDEVNSDSCNILLKNLLALNEEDPDSEIKLFINSPGGSVRDGMGIIDAIRVLPAPLTTIAVGMAASMGGLFFLTGKRRIVTEHSQIMLHDPSYSNGDRFAGMKPHELAREATELTKIRDMTAEIIAEVTGKTMKEVIKVTKEDSYFDAKKALDWGLATEIAKKGDLI